jgi:hypothetical protein
MFSHLLLLLRRKGRSVRHWISSNTPLSPNPIEIKYFKLFAFSFFLSFVFATTNSLPVSAWLLSFHLTRLFHIHFLSLFLSLSLYDFGVLQLCSSSLGLLFLIWCGICIQIARLNPTSYRDEHDCFRMFAACLPPVSGLVIDQPWPEIDFLFLTRKCDYRFLLARRFSKIRPTRSLSPYITVAILANARWLCIINLFKLDFLSILFRFRHFDP